MRLRVRMAARMSRALAFSPLAMEGGEANGAGNGRANWALGMTWFPSPGVNGPAIGA